MTNRKVIHAVCHDVVFIQGIGQLGKTLSLKDPQFKWSQTLKMEWETGTGLLWFIHGRSGVIPSASVFMVEFAPEDKPFAPSVVKSQAV